MAQDAAIIDVTPNMFKVLESMNVIFGSVTNFKIKVINIDIKISDAEVEKQLKTLMKLPISMANLQTINLRGDIPLALKTTADEHG